MLAQVQSAVDAERFARHVRSAVADKICHGLCDVIRRAQTPQGYASKHLADLIGTQLRGHIRFDKSRRDGINGDPTGADLLDVVVPR